MQSSGDLKLDFKLFGGERGEGAAADVQNLEMQLQDTQKVRDNLKRQVAELEGQVAQHR